MKVLLAVDGSSYSTVAIKLLRALALPSQTTLIALTVVPKPLLSGESILGKLTGRGPAIERSQQDKALALLQDMVQMIGTKKFKIERVVRWGDPAEVILKVADESKVDMVLIGARGLTDSIDVRLGSVAQTVMKRATASVLIARIKPATTNRVLLATDGSKYSDLVIQFLLKLPLPQESEVFLVMALQSNVEAFLKTQTLNLRTDQQLLADIQAAEENATQRIAAKSEGQFKKKGYKTTTMVVRGPAAESILKVAEQYDPDIIAVGRKGLTGTDTVLLGSVAERLARYAPCSVFIGPTRIVTTP